jgi:hypothetical protein
VITFVFFGANGGLSGASKVRVIDVFAAFGYVDLQRTVKAQGCERPSARNARRTGATEREIRAAAEHTLSLAS